MIAMISTTVYIVSGLGADERVFQYLDLSGYDIKHIQWIIPVKNESLQEYARRLSAQIKHEKPILIGMSFGAIMAVEIGKFIKTEKIILLSSVKTKNELPAYLKLIGKLRLHKLSPASLLKFPN